MVVILLIIIIVILAPGLIGLLAGATIGLASFYAPLIIAAIIGGCIVHYSVKNNAIPEETIKYQWTRQTIDDKYAAFYVLCNDWVCLFGGTPVFKEVFPGRFQVSCYDSSAPLEYLLEALELPCSSVASLEDAYKKGERNYSCMKWYEGNRWNKFDNIFSSREAIPNLHHLAQELEKSLKVHHVF